MKTVGNFVLSGALVLGLLGNSFAQTSPDQVTGDAITGTVNIKFKSRSDVNSDGTPKTGAVDTYTVNLKIHGARENTILRGTITRVPYTKSGWGIWATEQKPQLKYDLTVDLEQVTTKKILSSVGKFVGAIPMDVKEQIDGGVRYDLLYDLSGESLALDDKAKGSLFRLRVNALGVSQPEINESFTGKMLGKRRTGEDELEDLKKKKDAYSISKLKVWQKGKQVEIPVSLVDPLKFINVSFPKGPVARLSGGTISGDLNYEYETANWITQGITISYPQSVPDVITGGIQWIEPEDENVTPHYNLSLKFNEQSYYQGKGKDADVFADDSKEEVDPFAVDTGLPALSGKIEYRDTTGAPVAGRKKAPVIESAITYSVKANKLSSRQIMSFAKLWLLIVGPVNDD